MKKLLIGTGIALALVVFVAGGLFVNSAYAQGPNGFPGYAAMHDNTALLKLLGLTEQDLIAQRKAGKSLLDIAKAKGVDEATLTAALAQTVTAMHGWMGQSFGNQNYATQMTQWMRDWIAKDIRETQLGTMTDTRLGLGTNGTGYGMMGGANGFGGMMGGQFNTPNGFGGMMGGQFNAPNGFGGMMGGGRR
ncbi:MAG: hypothetical protein HY782_04710 [Chloroflexi bacterium]|nr:hypothetical protein [Chloroflexota bacterium]